MAEFRVGDTIPRTVQIWRGFFLLSRPVNAFISFLAIFIAAVVSGSVHPVFHVLAACLSGAFITAGANAINDYYDLEIDLVNKPERPLPANMITKTQARWFSYVTFTIGVLLGATISYSAFLIALVFSILLFLYSAFFKRMVLIGNLTVSLATAAAFIYGGLAVNRIRAAIFPAVFAFLMHFGREIIKDMEDMHGDQLHNANTLPVRYGLTPAKWLTTVLFIILILATLAPYVLGIYGAWYLILVVSTVNTVLLFTIISMWKRSTVMNFRFLSALLKADMFAGLFAIYAGRWTF